MAKWRVAVGRQQIQQKDVREIQLNMNVPRLVAVAEKQHQHPPKDPLRPLLLLLPKEHQHPLKDPLQLQLLFVPTASRHLQIHSWIWAQTLIVMLHLHICKSQVGEHHQVWSWRYCKSVFFLWLVYWTIFGTLQWWCRWCKERLDSHWNVLMESLILWDLQVHTF